MSVEPSPASHAVFLSYASQDAATARRICDTLRAAGLEVWFDQSELRGGDSWDQKIKKQIKECVLFMPVISAATQARREGYFRLEWHLADQRSLLMARGTPFIVPVCIDQTTDSYALVPESFQAVQWTRLPEGGADTAFVAQVKSLLGGEVEVARAFQPVSAEPAGWKARATNEPVGRRLSPAKWGGAIVLIGIGVAAFLWLRRPATDEQKNLRPDVAATASKPAPTPPPAPAPSPAETLANRARALYEKVGFSRDDLALADDFAKRATETDPTLAFAWGVRAYVQAAFLFRGYAAGDEFVQRSRDGQSFANRALALQPDEGEALLGLGRVAEYQNAVAQAEEIFQRALAAHPDDIRVRRALGTMLRNHPKRRAEALTVLLEAVKRAPRDPLARYDLAQAWTSAGNQAAAWEEVSAAIAIQPFGSALLKRADLAYSWKGDIPAMRAAFDQLAPEDRTTDRAVFLAMLCGVLERNPERVVAAAALTSRDYLEEAGAFYPKAWFPALAYRAAGKENNARLAWQAAEALLRERIRSDPKNGFNHVQLAQTLAWLGQMDEAARELAPIEVAWREQMTPQRASSLASYYGASGDAARAVPYLRQSLYQPFLATVPMLRLYPWWDKLRGTPEFEALLAHPPPEPAPIEPAPYAGKAPAAATPASREADQLIARVYALMNKVSYTRENLDVAEDLTRQATELAPESARAWAARARVHACWIQRTWDGSDKRLQDVQTFAARALALDPDSADAMIAQAIVTTRQGNPAQSEATLRRAVQLRPADPAARRLMATALWLQGRNDDALASSLETARLFPDDALAQYDLGNSYTSSRSNEPDLALKAFDAALAIEPFGSAILAKVLILIGSKGDFAAARRALDQLSPADRGEDRAVSFAMWLGLLQRDRDRVESAAALTTRTYFEDTYFYGPKAWMLALALRQGGKETMARVEWQAAEKAVREHIKTRPDEMREKFRLCTTLAWLGRTAEIAAEVATIEGVARETDNYFIQLGAAQFYAALGDAPNAVVYLRKVLNGRDTLTDRTLAFDPWWDKLHGTPEFEALLAEAKARVEKAPK